MSAQNWPIAIVCRPQSAAEVASLCPTAVVLRNDRAERGMGTSIASAARWAAENERSALIIALADMPFVSSGHFAALAALAKTGTGPVASQYPDGTMGVPAAFGIATYDALTHLSATGAGQLLQSDAIRYVRPRNWRTRRYRYARSIDSAEEKLRRTLNTATPEREVP